MVALNLQRPTLVLNRNWQAIHVTTVVRALTLVWNGTARFVDPSDFRLYDWFDWAQLTPAHDEPFIRTGRQRIRVPEVMTLMSYDRVPTTEVTFSRRNVFKRDKYACQYCGQQPKVETLTIDHVVPRAQGGESTWTNCVLACLACNHRKANRTPTQANMRLRKEPTRPTWRPMYFGHTVRVQSWSKFISETYWNVELKS